MLKNKKFIATFAIGLAGMFWMLGIAIKKKAVLDEVFVEGDSLFQSLESFEEPAPAKSNDPKALGSSQTTTLRDYYLKVLTCIETNTCVDPPDGHGSFYDVTKTKAHEYLKNALEAFLEYKRFSAPETADLLRALKIPNDDIQILATELITRKKLTLEESNFLLGELENFLEHSFNVVSKLFLDLSSQRHFDFIDRGKVIDAMGAWLEEPLHSPISFIEEIDELRLNDEDKRLLSRNLCRFARDPTLEHAKKLIETKLSLAACR